MKFHKLGINVAFFLAYFLRNTQIPEYILEIYSEENDMETSSSLDELTVS